MRPTPFTGTPVEMTEQEASMVLSTFEAVGPYWAYDIGSKRDEALWQVFARGYFQRENDVDRLAQCIRVVK